MGYQNKAKAKSGFGGPGGAEGPPGPPGPPGPTGAGFTLSATGNFDIQSKKLENVSAATNGDDAVVKSQVFVADGDGNLEMGQKKIKNLTTDESVDLCAVNMATLKKHSATIGDIDLQEKYNVLNSKQRSLNELKTHYDSLVSFEEVKQNFLSRVETFSMGTALDMNHNAILNLKDPKLGKEPATKDYADKKLALAGGRMAGVINMGNNEITNLAEPTGNTDAATKRYVDGVDTKARNDMSKEVVQIQNLLDAKIDVGTIDQKGQKIVNLGNPTGAKDAATKDFVEKSHVSQSGIKQNVFLFQMQDVLESSSESNITVNGILKFANSPHTLFKNAYNFDIGKSASNEYNARIGFNFYRLPTGPYTYVVEYFPPTMTNVSVDCRSTPLNVNKQIFKQFPNYVKNIVQIHKWQKTAPDYLMVDIKSTGDQNSPAKGKGWMIVYGIEGTHNDVSSRVLDTPFLISGGSMLMQVPLDMANQVIRNLPMPTGTTQAASKEFVEKSIWNKTTVANFVDGFIREDSECFYSIDRGQKDEVVFDSTRAISTLFDKSLSGLNATESTSKFAPKLSTAKNKRRYFMTFSGTQRLLSLANLNPAAGTADILNAFILFRLSSHAGTHTNFRNGLFSNYVSGWNRLVCFTANTKNLLISRAKKDGSEFLGGENVQVTSAQWQTKANASELNKWCCLSVHWDVPGGQGKSSCWVNGKKLKSFQAKSSSGSSKTTLGDLVPTGLAGLNGDIQLFVLFEGQQMSDFLIKAHHKMICERYGVDHDEISFP